MQEVDINRLTEYGNELIENIPNNIIIVGKIPISHPTEQFGCQAESHL